MAKNEGKKFEEDFKNSIPSSMYYYRFRDGTANFNGQKNENVRFQQSNICDCMIHTKGTLFLLELKSHKNKSIPFNCIRDNQLKQLFKASTYPNVNAGIVMNFRDIEETYYVDVRNIADYIHTANRKSFPIDWVRENGILIHQELKKVRYSYNISSFIERSIA